jgi:acetyltransferase-like isoleucine patch superfamily enzyme
MRDRLVELHRRLAYERDPPLGSRTRQRLVGLRHRHADLRWGFVRLGPGFTLFCPGPATIEIGHGVEFRRNVHLELDHGARLVIGARTIFTHDVLIQCNKEIVIGERCLFANGSSVVDSKHAFDDPDRPMADQGLVLTPVRVGDDVWVSSKATVAADVGDRAVVAAGAVVTRPVAPWTVAGGVPARELRRVGRPAGARA